MTRFDATDILFEDNHLLIVNKHAGDLVQADSAGETGLEDAIKAFLRRRDDKSGDVFLGVVHRIDRPVSGAVLFAKTSKALVRLNEMIKNRQIDKTYWVITEALLPSEQGSLVHYIARDPKNNRSRAHTSPTKDSREARLNYRIIAGSRNYYLYEVQLLTGRHHQIRAQFSREGAPIRGDLKYGARRSLPSSGSRDGNGFRDGNLGGSRCDDGVGAVGGGGISLHSRSLAFVHPVRHEPILVSAPVPSGDNLWRFFEAAASEVKG